MLGRTLTRRYAMVAPGLVTLVPLDPITGPGASYAADECLFSEEKGGLRQPDIDRSITVRAPDKSHQMAILIYYRRP